ncbi:MAG: ergothioneine biosynthesis protein EgtC [Leptolyngbyaceae bacterium]|nr:ergothioneine biosynthesis protein EgtC [Leptolyngbyaceae bacterium]
MCRLLGYIGAPVQLDRLLYKPEHSLIVQSYQPLEMTAGLVNADGFGVGWYHPVRRDYPYAYRNVMPIWNDTNLPALSRYVESKCVVASVRSATPGLAVNLSNCPPFQDKHVLMVHNGFIENFRKTLYRPLRDRLSDDIYGSIEGSTDSEHLFALIRQSYEAHAQPSLEQSLRHVLQMVFDLADNRITVGANLILSDGDRLVACRASNVTPVPTLYWLANDERYPQSVLVASEPLFTGPWQPVPEHSILTVDYSLNVDIQPIF